MQESKYKMHRQSGQTQRNITLFCVRSNCGNANLSGMKLQRRPVDHKQGSKGVCCNSGGLYSNCETSACRRAEKLGAGPETLSCWPVSSLKSNRTRVVDRLQSAGFWENRPGEPAERTKTHTDSRLRSGHWAVGLRGLVLAINFLSLSLSLIVWLKTAEPAAQTATRSSELLWWFDWAESAGCVKTRGLFSCHSLPRCCHIEEVQLCCVITSPHSASNPNVRSEEEDKHTLQSMPLSSSFIPLIRVK